MDGTELNARETAAILGVCDRTLRLWVGADKLRPLAGSGGQGRALSFRRAEVEALKAGQTGPWNADVLARVLYAFFRKRELRNRMVRYRERKKSMKAFARYPEMQWTNPVMKVYQLRRRKVPEKQINQRVERILCASSHDRQEGQCSGELPTLDEVPAMIRTWSSRFRFTPREIEFLVAMLGVVEEGTIEQTSEEERVLSYLQGLLAKEAKVKRDAQRSTDANFVDRILDMVLAGDADGIHAYPDPPPFWMGDKDDEKQGKRTVLQMARRNQKALLRRAVIQGATGTTAYVKTASGRMFTGNPSSTKIARVLGIHRYQASRLWRRVTQKLGEDGILRLAFWLDLGIANLPRSWRGEYRYDGKKRRRFSLQRRLARDTNPAACNQDDHLSALDV